MRTIVLLIFASIFISNTTFSQNILLLKNGDKITGKLEEYKNDTITFSLSGSLLKFNKSSVASITFDNVISSSNKNESTTTKQAESKKEGRILGLVTYSYSALSPVSPDLGASVYIVDSLNVTNINWLLIDSSANINGSDATKYRQEYKLNRKAAKDISDRADVEISKFKRNENKILTEVDLNGNYSVKVKPGTYYILIKSNEGSASFSRNSFDTMVFNKITINDGEDKYLNKRFYLKKHP